MSSFNTISTEKLARLIGVPHGPVLIDVRTEEDFAADPRFIPGAIRRPYETVSSWAPEFAGHSAIVICDKGQKLSEGVAAWLRHAGSPSAARFLSVATPPGRTRTCRSCPKRNCPRATCRIERSG